MALTLNSNPTPYYIPTTGPNTSPTVSGTTASDGVVNSPDVINESTYSRSSAMKVARKVQQDLKSDLEDYEDMKIAQFKERVLYSSKSNKKNIANKLASGTTCSEHIDAFGSYTYTIGISSARFSAKSSFDMKYTSATPITDSKGKITDYKISMEMINYKSTIPTLDEIADKLIEVNKANDVSLGR